MFKFFVLSNSGSGEARRHFPFTSIIHKHVLPFFFTLVVLLFSSVPVSVHALADPDPEVDPVYETEIIRLADYVDTQLTPSQQDVFYIMFGAYLVAQGAMSQYTIDDPYTTQDGVIGWFKSCGIQFYNSAIVQNALIAPSVLVSQGLQDLVNVAMGLAIKAGLYTDQVTFVNDIMNSDHYFLPFNQGLQIGINQVLAHDNGLFDWQTNVDSFHTSNFTWRVLNPIPDSVASTYVQSVASILGPKVQVNDTKQYGTSFNQHYNVYYYNFVDTSNNPISQFALFLNSSTGRFSIVNAASSYPDIGNGVVFKASMYSVDKDIFGNVSFNSSDSANIQISGNVSLSDYPDPVDAVNYIYSLLSTNIVTLNLPKSQLTQLVYVGTSWSNKVVLTNSSDLNFNDVNIPYYLQVQNDYLLDLKGLIQDLIDVTVLKPVLYDNIYDPSGTQVTPVTNQVSVSVQLPDSGIDIPTNIFGGFFNSSDGFISYLWYMTKPLVVYTHDLLDCFWFGPEGGFDWSGPAPIVFGVISLGLIGGLIVKMLL